MRSPWGDLAPVFWPTTAEEKSALGGPGNDEVNKLSSAPSPLLYIFGRRFRGYESLALKIYFRWRALDKKKLPGG